MKLVKIGSHKLESRFLGETSITSDMQMTSLMAESEEELNSLLMRVKEGVKNLAYNSTFKK